MIAVDSGPWEKILQVQLQPVEDHGVVGDDLVAKTLTEKCLSRQVRKNY